MKKTLLFVFLSILIAHGTGFAFQYGPVEPTTKDGKVAVSAGYAYYSGKWEVAGTSFDMNRHNAYIQGNLGLFKNWEVYGRVGGANMKVKEFFTTAEDFNDRANLFGSFGVKGLIYQDKTFGFGPFGQVSYSADYKDSRTVTTVGGTGVWDAKLKNLWDVTAGFGFQAKLCDYFLLYGGPFAYWAQATVDASNTVPGDESRTSRTMKEKNNIGGFLGFRVPFTKKMSFDVEGQLKSQVTVGAAINYTF